MFDTIPGQAASGVLDAIVKVYKLGYALFGDDNEAPERRDAPENPNVTPGTSHPGEEQGHASRDADGNEISKGVKKANKDGKDAADDAKTDKQRLEALWKEHEKNANRTVNGNSPEFQQATDQAVRDGIRDARNLVSGAVDNNAARANGVGMPNIAGMNPFGGMGGGFPGMGMGGGGGFPGMGGMGGGQPMPGGQGFNPLDPSQHQPIANPLTDPTHSSDPSVGPAGMHGQQPGVDQNPNTPGGGTEHGTGNAHTIIADPATADSRDLVAADGTKTTAPDATAYKALAHAASHPSTPNWVEASYKAAGIDLPGNDAEPGKSVDINDIKPGDIVRFSDHDALVWGNGKIMNADGSLQDIGPAIEAGSLKGIYRPERPGSNSTGTTIPAANNPQPPATESE
ncbi:Uncharacterised protein [Mycobacteroides abscessus subsp. bolletii]|uniref:hypothetical protein n=1 Tax=Mycobacteroides abscessus TaxID=36809 RepID=UPI0009A90853|nr:hypothetical protein [Mycobacteroides abscessus]SKZ02738.1 Uncharacterised protein [Mycobacteroides abscessus subsp. bolletii]